MATRKAMSKKLRFEVFKRDSFTCQYCGRMSPDVVLEVDHISPVSKGGVNDILNLITSCLDCNRGKGAKTISDNQVLKTQQEQLKELNEKREQLKMMVKWRDELSRFDDEQVNIIDDMIRERSEFCLSETGRMNMLKSIKKYGIKNVMDATEISFNHYYKIKDDANKTINYIHRICASVKAQESDPSIKHKQYIRGIIKNRFGIYNESRLKTALEYVGKANGDYETVMTIAKTCKNWTCFFDELGEEFGVDL